MTTTVDLLTASSLIDQLAAASIDDLRALLGRLEDAERVTRAVLRERIALSRRNANWEVREKVTE